MIGHGIHRRRGNQDSKQKWLKIWCRIEDLSKAIQVLRRQVWKPVWRYRKVTIPKGSHENEYLKGDGFVVWDSPPNT